MRLSTLTVLPPALLLAVTTTAFQLPNFQPFLDALPVSLSDYLPLPPASNNNSQTDDSRHDLLKRQFSNTCPNGFDSCANLGAPGLCCASAAVCSADFAGNVACCPSGAACSGTVGAVVTAGTVDRSGNVVGAGAPSTTPQAAAGTSSFVFATTTSNGLVAASSLSTVGTDGGNSGESVTGFVIASGSVVATPGLAVRGAQIPLIAKVIVRVLEYLPV